MKKHEVQHGKTHFLIVYGSAVARRKVEITQERAESAENGSCSTDPTKRKKTKSTNDAVCAKNAVHGVTVKKGKRLSDEIEQKPKDHTKIPKNLRIRQNGKNLWVPW